MEALPRAAEGLGRLDDREEGFGRPVSNLRAVPLLADVGEEDLLRLQASAHETEVEAGLPIVTEWEATRDFYVVLDGNAEVWRGGECRAVIGPGGFFGELAAIDWGASFGYSMPAWRALWRPPAAACWWCRSRPSTPCSRPIPASSARSAWPPASGCPADECHAGRPARRPA